MVALAITRFAHNFMPEHKVYKVNFKESGAFPRLASPAACNDPAGKNQYDSY
jgi:hypothetical protein